MIMLFKAVVSIHNMNLFTDTVEESTDALSYFQENHPEGPYFVSYEVFAIKLSYNETVSKWLFSTKKKENAFASFWAERRSFGNLFLDEVNKLCGIDELVSLLIKSEDYYFLVPLRGKNRVILTKEQEDQMGPTIFLAGVVPSAPGSKPIIFETQEDRDRYKGPWKFLPVVDPLNDDPANYPLSIGISYFNINATQCPEYARKEESTSYRLVRFLFPEYQKLRNLRNNVSDIYMRYGQLWAERSPDTELYRRHYSAYIVPFDNAVEEIYKDYKTRYFLKEYVSTTRLRHAILKKIRDIQVRRQWDTVSKNNIYNVIFKNFSSKLFKI